MNENLILVVDYEKICRLCLHATEAMSDLFEFNKRNTLKDLVLRATGLDVVQHDGFPSNICYRCRYIVELTCELRDMVDKTNMLLVNAGSHIESMEEQEEMSSDKALAKIMLKKHLTKEKPDLRLIMQDDGVMTLVNPDHGTPVDVKVEHTGDENKDIAEKKQKYAYNEEDIKVIVKALPKRLTCQICLDTFPSAEDVSSHAKEHYIDSSLTPYTKLQRPFKCEVCNRTVSKTQLIAHHRSHLNINPFVCKQAGCNYVGKSQNSLRRHLQKHGARSQVCEVCGAAYKRRFELRQHMMRAHRPAPAHCRKCRKRFRNAITFKAHMQQCHKPGRYNCEWPGCAKAYHTPAVLADHVRTHTDDRVFRCHLCAAAAYTSQSLLNRHLRMHERERMSKCDKCSMTFDDYGAFYRHRVAEHGQWLRYRCLGCHKRYQTESKLEEHLEMCEQAIAAPPAGGDVETGANTGHNVFVTSIQEIVDSDKISLEEEDQKDQVKMTEDLLDKFKGQSLLVQPGNMSDLSKELELQDLPPDGLLYVEVDPEGEAEDDVHDSWQ